MDFRDFLSLAVTLSNGTTEAEWRSASSRAYYAAFHVARQKVGPTGFARSGLPRKVLHEPHFL